MAYRVSHNGVTGDRALPEYRQMLHHSSKDNGRLRNSPSSTYRDLLLKVLARERRASPAGHRDYGVKRITTPFYHLNTRLCR
jgi:hypothetical protein